MKRQLCLMALACLAMMTNAQTTASLHKIPDTTGDYKGIEWATGLSWEQVKEKAKKENKYIFVDCFATWCKPCKKMDNEIYPNDTVGDFSNASFLSVRMQFDTTKKDNEDVKKWYSTAAFIRNEYKVNAFPTFLFFTPAGQIIHRDLGGKDVQQFIQIIKNALDSNTQYYTRIDKFKAGKLEFKDMPLLCDEVRNAGDINLAKDIALAYIEGYSNKISDVEFYQRENLIVHGRNLFAVRHSDKFFKSCLSHADKIDSIIRKGYANEIVNSVINRDGVYPFIEDAKVQGQVPNWAGISRTIQKKYRLNKGYIDLLVLRAKVNYYKAARDWKLYTKFLVHLVDDERDADPQSSINLSSRAWEIFLYSNVKSELTRALSWINELLQEQSLNINTLNSYSAYVVFRSGYLDTKASLLYKIGRIEEAKRIEKQALNIVQNFIKSQAGQKVYDRFFTKENNYQKVLIKMEANEPIWEEAGAIWDNKKSKIKK